MRILIVEDDPRLGTALKEELSRSGFMVDWALDGNSAEFKGSTEDYDLVILDLGLPDLPGLEVLKSWRQSGNPVPVLILTARDAWHERVDGLKAGADDYLGKPFHSEELLARVSAILKRSHGRAPGCLNVAGIALDEDRCCASIDGGPCLPLSGSELRMLRAFLLHPGQFLSKTHLCRHVYGPDQDPDSNTIEVYISKLRNKIGRERIQSRRGQGYVLIVE